MRGRIWLKIKSGVPYFQYLLIDAKSRQNMIFLVWYVFLWPDFCRNFRVDARIDVV